MPSPKLRIEMTPFPQRKSPRLQGYDYASDGAYFVTVCTYQRELIFGDVVEGEMRLDPLGELVQDTWLTIPKHKRSVSLDYFVVMPNHFHGILILSNVENTRETDTMHGVPTISDGGHVGTGCIPSADVPKRPTLGQIIGHFKAAVTRQARQQNIYTDRVWQSRFHDHIIRSDERLNLIRQYVVCNPQKWEEDTFYRETYL